MTKKGLLKARLAWPARLDEQDDGTVIVTFRDIPAAMTQGDDRADTMAMARDALDEALAAYIKAREDIPAPSRAARGEILVAPDAAVALKALVHTAMRADGVSNVDMAARLGIDEKEVRRMLDPAHTGTKISRYEAALAACDIEVAVSAFSTPPLRVVNA